MGQGRETNELLLGVRYGMDRWHKRQTKLDDGGYKYTDWNATGINSELCVCVTGYRYATSDWD